MKRKLLEIEKDTIINDVTYIGSVKKSVKKTQYVNFMCHCGEEFFAQKGNFIRGLLKSCGCTRRARIDHNSHGDTKKDAKYRYIYNLWISIYQRCYDKNFNIYEKYGGRGIEMSKKWIISYKNFKKDILTTIGERPSKKYKLIRLDKSKGYNIKNIAWSNTPTIRGKQYNK